MDKLMDWPTRAAHGVVLLPGLRSHACLRGNGQERRAQRPSKGTLCVRSDIRSVITHFVHSFGLIKESTTCMTACLNDFLAD